MFLLLEMPLPGKGNIKTAKDHGSAVTKALLDNYLQKNTQAFDMGIEAYNRRGPEENLVEQNLAGFSKIFLNQGTGGMILPMGPYFGEAP